MSVIFFSFKIANNTSNCWSAHRTPPHSMQSLSHLLFIHYCPPLPCCCQNSITNNNAHRTRSVVAPIVTCHNNTLNASHLPHVITIPYSTSQNSWKITPICMEHHYLANIRIPMYFLPNSMLILSLSKCQLCFEVAPYFYIVSTC